MKKYLSNDFDFKEYVNVADECPIWSAPFGLKLLDHIDYKKNISALDIGFGTGFPVEQIFDTIELRLNELAKNLGSIKLSIPFVLINAIKNQ